MKKQLLGVNITVDNKEIILQEIQDYLHGQSKKSPFVIFTPNPEQLVYARENEEFLKLLNRADVALPDGIGLVWAFHFLKLIPHNASPITRISGIDFMSDLIRLANKNNWEIGLVGGWNGVGKKALAVLQTSYANLRGWALEPEETDEEKLTKHIADSNTKIVFVGLGAPKQEQYIESIKYQVSSIKLHNRVVFMAVGGSFEMIAGIIPRAPRWIQTIGLEWLYRLFQEPWRWKRQIALLRFLSLVIREKIPHTK